MTRYWETLFVGLYKVTFLGLLKRNTPQPNFNGFVKAGEADHYDLVPMDELLEYIMILFIELGTGYLSWIQRANPQDKTILKFK